MNTVLYRALVLNEWRLRSRRASSLVILLAVVAATWLMVLDPASGMAMMVVDRQRIAYESPALAFATNLIASILFGLAGFYLARGRSQEDLRCGTAAVLAATPVGNAQLLGARWLGAFGFLFCLGAVVMLTAWVLQLVRGEGPLHPVPYLQMLVLGLAPGLMWCASLAVLADAWAPLMGKRGDLLYWLLWMAQFAFLPAMLGQGAMRLTGWQVFDIGGASPLIVGLSQLMSVQHIAVGGSPFDATRPLLHMPTGLWSSELIALRLGAMVLALLPLVPAALLFHRYAPGTVKLRAPSSRSRVGAVLQALLRPVLRPFTALVHGLLSLAARVPGVAGRWLADVALLLLSQPALGVVMLAGMVAGACVPTAALAGVLAATVCAWGLAVSDVSARDAQSGTGVLASAVPGGPRERTMRQAAVAVGLGLLVVLPALGRLVAVSPVQSLACVAGLACLGVGAALLGRLTRGSRTFLALFLFALYVSLQRTGVAALDAFGIAGDASLASAAGYGLAAVLGSVALYRAGS
ncbi:MAG: hypothetical protein EKK53_03225 [Burkholderiales bacterium]|nr:MAG: hypothetical protein EKK53_03225 [Burkholderiales bacterium]